ncbi:bestrophin family ion channel [Moritella sp. 28]|uniref:bestrophin family ion channel n=1 Tax=Moritella sp. 28 TaxID=2746232 RepID=UPI00351D92D4
MQRRLINLTIAFNHALQHHAYLYFIIWTCCLYFLGLDALSEELEQPFGMYFNDLHLHSMSRSVEIGLLEMITRGLLSSQIIFRTCKLQLRMQNQ